MRPPKQMIPAHLLTQGEERESQSSNASALVKELLTLRRASFSVKENASLEREKEKVRRESTKTVRIRTAAIAKPEMSENPG